MTSASRRMDSHVNGTDGPGPRAPTRCGASRARGGLSASSGWLLSARRRRSTRPRHRPGLPTSRADHPPVLLPPAARNRRIGSSTGSRLNRKVEWWIGRTYSRAERRNMRHASSGEAWLAIHGSYAPMGRMARSTGPRSLSRVNCVGVRGVAGEEHRAPGLRADSRRSPVAVGHHAGTPVADLDRFDRTPAKSVVLPPGELVHRSEAANQVTVAGCTTTGASRREARSVPRSV